LRVPRKRSAPQQSRPVATADLVADAVADDRCADHQRQQHGQLETAVRGKHTTDDARGLTGKHEPDEHSGLSEHERGDDEVGQAGRDLQQMVDQTAHAGLRRCL